LVEFMPEAEPARRVRLHLDRGAPLSRRIALADVHAVRAVRPVERELERVRVVLRVEGDDRVGDDVIARCLPVERDAVVAVVAGDHVVPGRCAVLDRVVAGVELVLARPVHVLPGRRGAPGVRARTLAMPALLASNDVAAVVRLAPTAPSAMTIAAEMEIASARFRIRSLPDVASFPSPTGRDANDTSPRRAGAGW